MFARSERSMILAALLSLAAFDPEVPLPEPARPADAALAVVAERSEYKTTSTSGEVVAQLDAVARTFPAARRLSLGKSGQGREIPVIVLADPPVASAAEARRQAAGGKLVVLLFGNIHAGECDGKEALGILARQLAAPHPLLKRLVVAIAPNYNADGNDNTGPTATNRPGQVGPERCGRRENAAGLDLNRDFTKLDAPETRALVGFMNEWDPDVVVDCHTTDGSWHRYLVTTAGPKAPATAPALLALAHDEFFPALFDRFRASTLRDAYWYGNFEGEFGDADRGHSKWESFPAEARYGTTYIGLRGRLSVLVESYSYATYRDRVLGSLAYCTSILEVADRQREQIRAITAAQDRPQRVAIRSRAAKDGRAVIKGFKEATADGRSTSTGEPQDYEVDLWTRFEAAIEADVPAAYAIPAAPPAVEATLRAHGIRIGRLAEHSACEVEVQEIVDAKPASRRFQGRVLATLETRQRREARTLEKGVLVVPTDQPLARLIVYLLEPRSEDGLGTWGFFDEGSRIGGDFPVLRVRSGELKLEPAPAPAPAAQGAAAGEPPASPHLE